MRGDKDQFMKKNAYQMTLPEVIKFEDYQILHIEKEEDIERIVQILKDDKLSSYLRMIIGRKGTWFFGIFIDETYAGYMELRDYEDDTVTLGYRTVSSMRNQGVMKMALLEFSDAMVRENPGLCIRAYVDDDNEASMHVLKYAGFEKTQELDGGKIYMKKNVS